MPEHKHGLASMAGCNFTMGGFARSSDLRLARRLGLKVIAMPDEQDMRTWSKAWKQLSDPEIDARIRRVVQQCGRSETVLGYFIMDEPGASYFPALAKAVAAVKKYAPGKLAYINLYPGYATLGATNGSQLETATFSEYLERFVQEAKPQVLSYDNYKVQDSLDLTQPDRAARYFYDLLEVRRVAQKFGLPFWNIVSANQIRPHTTIPAHRLHLADEGITTAFEACGVSDASIYYVGHGDFKKIVPNKKQQIFYDQFYPHPLCYLIPEGLFEKDSEIVEQSPLYQKILDFATEQNSGLKFFTQFEDIKRLRQGDLIIHMGEKGKAQANYLSKLYGVVPQEIMF